MPVNQQYDLFGKKVSQTYHNLLQSGSDGKFYDGDGNEVTINATIPDIYVKYSQTGSFATTGSNIFRGDQTVTGSLFTTGSNTLIGSTTLTGSLNVSGSTTQVGNNSLLGNTTLSGSIIISGAFGTNNPTVQIYGDTTHNGYIRFDPVTSNINTSISASYIYVSGSTNDLYFSQNGNGYSNTTRLRWLEGNLYTGLLNGGVIYQVNSNTYQVASGSGVIVNLNASYNDNPYPTIQYLNWGNLTKTIDALSGSFDQQFVAINSSSAIFAQGTPYEDGQYNTLIPLGVVVHQNRSSINAVQSFPGVAYGWKQRSYDFIRAFGPLKISGYTLAQSGSSTRGLVLSGGTAWVDGRNWIVDPNNPSYITEATGITTSKIYRYRQSGSGWAYDTNAGAGYTDIDPTQYSLNGSLTAVSSNHWTIQRVYYFPNSATKALYIYYGNAEYANQIDALAAVTTEPFSEAPNTAANAIYIGYMLLRNNASFNTAASFTIQAGGLFRGSGGGGGGGGGGTTSPGGSNTQIQYNNNGVFDGVPNLTWDGTTLHATGSFTGSFTGSLLGTASYAANGGVTQLLAGPNISLSPTNGLGQVTITSTGGGGGTGNTATGSYGSFYSTQTQNVVAINTPTSMSFNNTDITNGVSISGSANASIKIANAGVYDLQFSAQLQKQGSGGGVANVLIWLRKNNIDLAATNTYVELPGGTNSKTVAAWNWFLNAAAGDEYRIMWSTDDTNAQLYYDSSPTVGPTVPSVIATVARVDQFLSNTGSFSGSFIGEFTGSLLGTASWANNATTASYVLNAVSSSFSSTSSYISPNNALIAGLPYTIYNSSAAAAISTSIDFTISESLLRNGSTIVLQGYMSRASGTGTVSYTWTANSFASSSGGSYTSATQYGAQFYWTAKYISGTNSLRFFRTPAGSFTLNTTITPTTFDVAASGGAFTINFRATVTAGSMVGATENLTCQIIY